MTWCPVPVNIFPKNPNNTVGQKQLEDAANKSANLDGEWFLLKFVHFFFNVFDTVLPQMFSMLVIFTL